MKWNEVLIRLDAVRALIRSQRDPKADVSNNDPILDMILECGHEGASMPMVDLTNDPLAATVPTDFTPIETVLYETWVEGAKMQVMARGAKPPIRPVDVIEVTEKELAKP